MNQTNAMELENDNALAESQRTLKVSDPPMQGSDVKQLQKKLMSKGYALPQYGADGIYGTETAAAVKAFQNDTAGLDATGIVNAQTRSKINSSAPATTSQASILSFANPMKLKTQFWDPLSSSQKWMYGGGAALLIVAGGMAILNDQ